MARVVGEEQPYIKLGIFKLRLPFIHYKWSNAESVQAILMSATCLSAIPILQEVFGISFELAWSMVIINGVLYSLHALLGDPVVPGWITPAIPLVVAHVTQFDGVERIHAVIALQLSLGILFIIMGMTGFAQKLIKIIPDSIKSGILLGAGIGAIIGEFKDTGRFNIYPISITIGAAVAFYVLFSASFVHKRKSSKLFDNVGKYGMLSAIIIAIIVGPIVQELPFPSIDFSSFIKIPDFAGLIATFSIANIGLPSLNMFISALPMIVVCYIIAFGDFVTAGALITEASEVRADEKIDFNPNRSNLISGLRNVLMALIAPYIQLCGPLWAATTATIAQRYKEGRDSMDSIFSGVGTFRLCTMLSVMIVPVVSIVQPILPVALSLTMLVQGFVCTRLAMSICKTDLDRGISGVMGAVLATKGAAWGLGVGIILHLILSNLKKENN